MSIPVWQDLPDNARDCYEVAAERGISIMEAVRQMEDEGWRFVDYDAVYGTYKYVPPVENPGGRPPKSE